jgi:cell division protein FtsQ
VSGDDRKAAGPARPAQDARTPNPSRAAGPLRVSGSATPAGHARSSGPITRVPESTSATGAVRTTGPMPASGSAVRSTGPIPASGGSGAAGLDAAPSRGSRWRAAFFVLALVGIVGAAGWALLGSRLLVVRVITVTGTHLVSAGQVRAAADVPAGTPLIRIDPGQVATRVEAIQQVASAQVTKDWPDGLSITVRERVAVIAVPASGGGYDLLDRDGVIVTSSASKPAPMPLLVTSAAGRQLRGNQGVATVAQVLAVLPSWLSHQVSRVSVREPDGGRAQIAGLAPVVTLYLSGGQTVVWGDAGSSGVKARELAILMRGQATYYDLSAPGTVVTK